MRLALNKTNNKTCFFKCSPCNKKKRKRERETKMKPLNYYKS